MDLWTLSKQTKSLNTHSLKHRIIVRTNPTLSVSFLLTSLEALTAAVAASRSVRSLRPEDAGDDLLSFLRDN